MKAVKAAGMEGREAAGIEMKDRQTVRDGKGEVRTDCSRYPEKNEIAQAGKL